MRADGSHKRRLARVTTMAGFDWAPDSRRLVYAAEKLFSISVHGGGSMQLTSAGSDTSPAVSPDGKTVAFARYRFRPESDVYQQIRVTNMNGSGRSRLVRKFGVVYTDDESTACFQLSWQPRPARSRAAAAPPRWHPDVAAARHYAAHRHGIVSFAVRTEGGHVWGLDRARVVPSLSVLKPMLLVAYLRRPGVRHRALSERERGLLSPMIRRSDNVAATQVRDVVGNRGLRRLARRVGMHHFTPVAHPWGNSRVNAADQTRFFLHIDRFVPRRHRRFALHLLASIVPSQRWGVARVAPAGWSLYFKGGWGSGTGSGDHQVALLRRGPLRVAVAVMTLADGTHAYGKTTLEGVFRRLLRGI